ncbi:serine proteinase inhibitor [Penaeus vannamei]|uniref:Serine proteinase inhibitor n=1 Tax=Penaeus vannamei TaxID=6689 RepID=A0A423U7R8_PENVA|nr:serine proteinase inhibitor [Penaeus vannamei]
MYISVSPRRLSVVGESALREKDFSRSSVTLGAALVLVSRLSLPDAAAADINAFINAETRGKIPKLIEPSFVKDAKMVLTNAVYFKGFWKYPFKPQRTYKDKFFVTPEEYVQVDMMTQTGRFKYVDSEKLHAQVLEMPYRGDAVSMVVLLPRYGRAKEVDRLVRRLRPRRLVSGEGDALRPADSQVSQDQRGEYSRG